MQYAPSHTHAVRFLKHTCSRLSHLRMQYAFSNTHAVRYLTYTHTHTHTGSEGATHGTGAQAHGRTGMQAYSA